jgi:hypothetical protein
MRTIDPRRFLAPLVLSLVCAGALTPPASEAASRRYAAPPPEISAFDMEPVDRVAPGAELFFRVQGTPNARATVRVAGVQRTIVLQEVDDGVYEGSYTLRPRDRVSPESAATVTLRRNNRASTSTMGHLVAAAPNPPVVSAQPARPAAPANITINRFVVRPIDKIEPGTELRFLAEGTPGARATFTIEGVAANLPMRELSPGRYEGTYTIKRYDKIFEGMPIVAAFEANGQVARANLARGGMLVDARPPTVRNLHPKDGETVLATGPVSVTGTFDDRGGVGVDPATVKLMLGGRDVTAQATVSRDFFTYRSELAPGRYVADVTARDAAGNPVRTTWSFVVEQQPTAAVGLPLEVTSHSPNSVVGAGRLQVRGRTAPGATVDVEVNGVASVAGMIGVTQKLYSERLIADESGRFSFAFQPQLQVPGMRYEVDIKATAGNATRENKLVLFQQR